MKMNIKNLKRKEVMLWNTWGNNIEIQRTKNVSNDVLRKLFCQVGVKARIIPRIDCFKTRLNDVLRTSFLVKSRFGLLRISVIWVLEKENGKIKLRKIYEMVEKNEEKDVECDFKEVCDYDYHKKRIERRVKEVLEDTTLRDLLFAEHLKNS